MGHFKLMQLKRPAKWITLLVIPIVILLVIGILCKEFGSTFNFIIIGVSLGYTYVGLALFGFFNTSPLKTIQWITTVAIPTAIIIIYGMLMIGDMLNKEVESIFNLIITVICLSFLYAGLTLFGLFKIYHIENITVAPKKWLYLQIMQPMATVNLLLFTIYTITKLRA
jgi:hypothetical protein